MRQNCGNNHTLPLVLQSSSCKKDSQPNHHYKRISNFSETIKLVVVMSPVNQWKSSDPSRCLLDSTMLIEWHFVSIAENIPLTQVLMANFLFSSTVFNKRSASFSRDIHNSQAAVLAGK
jgi:hypothetical protein